MALLGGSLPLVAAVLLPGEFYVGQGSRKFVDAGNVQNYLLLLGAFVLAIWLGRALLPPSSGNPVAISGRGLTRLRQAAVMLFWLSMVGYMAWAMIGIARGLSVEGALQVLRQETGSIYEVKGLLAPVAGVTTLTQLGPMCLSAMVVVKAAGSGTRTGKYFTALLLAGALRALLFAERLALLELVVAIVVTAAMVRKPGRSRNTWKWNIAPLLGVLLLPLLFGLFEYSRSWVNFYSTHFSGNFAEFVLTRLLMYYATAVNNTAMALHFDGEGPRFPTDTFSFIWNAPLLEAVMAPLASAGAIQSARLEQLRTVFADPQFTNNASMLNLQFELGVWFALVFVVALGLLLGVVYGAARRTYIPGVVLYSAWFVGFVELGRITYWTSGRAFPQLLAFIGLAIWMRKTNGERNDLVCLYKAPSIQPPSLVRSSTAYRNAGERSDKIDHPSRVNSSAERPSRGNPTR